MWSNVFCGALAVILPVSLMAQDTASAILRSDGTTQVNDRIAPNSSALFPHDLIQTPKAVGARIETVGSFADINPETLVQFDGDELVLDHGSLSVSTSRGLRVRVGCVTVTPVNLALTNYTVTDRDGKVTVSAFKNDVYIDARSKALEQQNAKHSERMMVREGEQKSRSEKCGAADIKSPDYIDGKGALLNSPWAKAAGIGDVILTCLELCHGDDPVSPSHPR
jgi:hypothetical protein